MCSRAFESGLVPEYWRFAVTVSVYKGKVETTECKNYRGINAVGKIYSGILAVRIHT